MGTILVTGGASGIGAATCGALESAGYPVSAIAPGSVRTAMAAEGLSDRSSYVTGSVMYADGGWVSNGA